MSPGPRRTGVSSWPSRNASIVPSSTNRHSTYGCQCKGVEYPGAQVCAPVKTGGPSCPVRRRYSASGPKLVGSTSADRMTLASAWGRICDSFPSRDLGGDSRCTDPSRTEGYHGGGGSGYGSTFGEAPD